MKKSVLLLIAMMLCMASTNAQKVWTLEKCVNHALQQNITIEQLRLAENLAALDVDQAEHAKYPNLNASSGVNWNFGRTIDPVSNSFSTETFFANNLSLSSGVTLYNGGRIKKTLEQSKVNQKASALDTQQAERDIALMVANAYLAALFAQENQKITQSQLDLSIQQLEQVEKLIRAGVRPANEKLNLEAQISLNEQNVIIAENNIATAILNLKQLLQLDIEEEILVEAPTEDIVILTDCDVITFDEIYASATKTQPNIAASEFDLQSAEIAIEIAETAKMPNLSAGIGLGTNYSNRGILVEGFETQFQSLDVVFNNVPTTIEIAQEVPVFGDYNYFDQINDNLSVGAGLSLNIPIYNNHINKNNIERAKINRENTELSNALLRNNLKTNVQQALSDARTAKKALKAAEFALDAQNAAFANAKKKYDLGDLNTYNFVDAKTQLDNAQLNLVLAKYDYYFKSKVIDFYMGYPLKLN